MPNIQMFGFTRREYRKKKAIIDEVMWSLHLASEAVTTRIHSDVRSCDKKNKRMPYIVVRSTGGMKEINQIVSALKNLGFGVDCEKEPLPSNGFIPADQMRWFHPK
jgi:hypothetical protein